MFSVICMSFVLLRFVNSQNAAAVSKIVETPDYWRSQAKTELYRRLGEPRHDTVAKNVILFLGDGMSIPTVTAGRILKGQIAGNKGEETQLSFDTFPITGFVKTYCQDAQVTDSAAAATAFLCGVKTNKGLVGVDATVTRGQCQGQKAAEVTSILDWSIAAGKSVGVITTTSITSATPAAAFANVADRNWESSCPAKTARCGCKDIAAQLVDDYPQIQLYRGDPWIANKYLTSGKMACSFPISNDKQNETSSTFMNVNHGNLFRTMERAGKPYLQQPIVMSILELVVMGGGRTHFMPKNKQGPDMKPGSREQRDLIGDWKSGQRALNRTYKYIWNVNTFNKVDPATTDSILGLFSSGSMDYDLERPADQPSLADMTELAIKILSKNPKGFFLLVEGGRIDHAHHAGWAKLALYDLIAFDNAVARGDQLTNENDTLTIVTADHSHTLTFAGYSDRGNDILGKTKENGRFSSASDRKPYTTLLYGNGPGYVTGKRPDITNKNTASKSYRQQAAVPLTIETHGGDDVGIWSRGPMAHLLSGTHEQNYIAHVMAYASCVGEYTSQCAKTP